MKKGKTKGDMTVWQITTKDNFDGNVFQLYEFAKSFERYTGNDYITYDIDDGSTRINKFRIDVQKFSTDMIELLKLFKRVPENWEGYGNDSANDSQDDDFYE